MSEYRYKAYENRKNALAPRSSLDWVEFNVVDSAKGLRAVGMLHRASRAFYGTFKPRKFNVKIRDCGRFAVSIGTSGHSCWFDGPDKAR